MLMSVVPGEGSSAAACRHLSWRFSWAKEMVDTSYELGFPLMAGSSLPVAWRMPPVDMPLGAEVEEVLGVGCECLLLIDVVFCCCGLGLIGLRSLRRWRRGLVRLPLARDDPVHGVSLSVPRPAAGQTLT